MKYLVKHWISVDMIAEELIDEKEINTKTNHLGKYEEPSENATFEVIEYKIIRSSYEDDTKSNSSVKERISDK